MHTIHDSIAMLSLKTLYPGGIRTRVFRSFFPDFRQLS
jgi:hypothetical protein